jgi:hypothetical protein
MKKKFTLLLALILLIFGSISAQNAWINEIHYDNTGTDANEAVEVVIENPGSYTLSDFTIALYNGNVPTAAVLYGTAYDLSQFTVGATVGNFTIYSYTYPSNGLQNGSPDGLCLAYQGVAISGQFLSYEGVMTASGGPADGLTSTDILVKEVGTEVVGLSLQLLGTGGAYSDFQWNNPTTATTGAVNNFQTFGTPSANPIVTNIMNTPTNPTTSEAVTITADVTDDVAVIGVNILWGTATGVYGNTVAMTLTTGDTYSGEIPAKPTAGTIYYMIQAIDADPNYVLSSEMTYDVTAMGPQITNIVQTPDALSVTSSDAVSVSADVTDDISVSTVDLKWGTATGVYDNTITMSLGTGSTYTTDTDIPAQADGTAIFYVIEATDGDANTTTSIEYNYTVNDPILPTEVATIAELRAGTLLTTEYEYTGEAVVTFDYTNGTYTKVWIEDATGAILIYDANSSEVTTSSYAIGDAVSGLTGTLEVYNGTTEFILSNAAVAPVSSGNAMPYQEVDAVTLNANYADYAEELITITASSFDEADGSAVFATSTNYGLTDATGTVVFRTAFSGVDYIGTIIPSGNKNVTCLVAQFSGTVQVTSRDLADIVDDIMTYSVTFNVDVTDSIASGWFVPATDSLFMAGDLFVPTWQTPGSDLQTLMLDADEDGIYTLTVSNLAAATYNYKYFKASTVAPTWDNGEWAGDPNRAVTVVDVDLVVNDVFGDINPGVQDISKGISIYPNPSNGLFNITVESNMSLEVYDITGKLMNTQLLNGASSMQINEAGIYFLRFSNEDGTSTQKVIVQ